MGTQLVEMKQQIAMKATLEGINDSFLVTADITGVTLILAFFIKRAKQEEDTIGEKPSGKKMATKLVEN